MPSSVDRFSAGLQAHNASTPCYCDPGGMVTNTDHVLRLSTFLKVKWKFVELFEGIAKNMKEAIDHNKTVMYFLRK